MRNFNIEFKLDNGRTLLHTIGNDGNGNVVTESEGRLWDVKETTPEALLIAIRTAVVNASEQSKDGITADNIERIVKGVYEKVSLSHHGKIVVEVGDGLLNPI